MRKTRTNNRAFHPLHRLQCRMKTNLLRKPRARPNSKRIRRLSKLLIITASLVIAKHRYSRVNSRTLPKSLLVAPQTTSKSTAVWSARVLITTALVLIIRIPHQNLFKLLRRLLVVFNRPSTLIWKN